MIRGYVAVVSSDLPLSQVPRLTSSTCRKATITLVFVDNSAFSINVEGSSYSFEVVGNIRTVHKHDIASGLVRIGFILPKLDIVISSNPSDLEAFIYTVEVIKDIKVLPPKCSNRAHAMFSSICKGQKFSKYLNYHIDNYICPLSGTLVLCAFCCYCNLQCYNDNDAQKILNTWLPQLRIAEHQTPIHSITVNSYPYLRTLHAIGNKLLQIPKALGSLPCLVELDLSDNQLGQATDWTWLTSPFIRQYLHCLYLASNGLSCIPEPIMGLRNLESLNVSNNSLTALPAGLANLKHMSSLHIGNNNMVILPPWVYRRKHFSSLFTVGNNFSHTRSMYNSKTQLSQEDFENVAVPSLFEIAAKYIITKRLPFWEYSIPATLAEHLEGAYYCRCGSLVFRNTSCHIQCWRIKTEALTNPTFFDDVDVPVAIHCCTHECFKLIEPYIVTL